MSKRAHFAVLAINCFFGCICLWLAFARYMNIHNQTFDLAFYARMAWGAVNGSFWDPIINAHFLGLHMSWLMLPLGLLGLVFGTVPVLLISQVVAVCAASWPLARCGARRFGDIGAIISASIWLLYPNLGHTLSYEFHPGTVATLPLAWALDSLDRQHRTGLALSSALLVACRADLSFMAFMIGVVAIWRGTATRRIGFGIAASSLFYLLFFVFVIHPVYAPAHGSLQAHFAKWGNSASEIFATVLFSPRELFAHLIEPRRLFYLPMLLAPLLFLPLLSPKWLLVALPPIAINLLSTFPTTTDMDCHYQTLIVPPLVMATIAGVGRMQSVRVKRIVWFLLLVGGVSSNLLAAGMPWSRDYRARDYLEDATTRSGRRTLSAIPKHVSVQAPDRFLPHLAERENLYRAPPPERNAQFVILDISHRQRYARRETLLRTAEEPNVRDWLARSDHALVHAEADAIILQRGRDPRDGLSKRYIVGTASPDRGSRLTECLSLLSATLRNDRLCLQFVARSSCARDLAIRLGPRPKSRRVDLLFDGLLSPVHLRRSDLVRSCHAFTDKERNAILLNGLYVGTLRQSGARPEPSDPTSVLVTLTDSP